jgi:hypothetical protein
LIRVKKALDEIRPRRQKIGGFLQGKWWSKT